MKIIVKCVECRCLDREKSICKLTGREVSMESERHCKRFGRIEKMA